MSIFSEYLSQVRRVHASGIATNERSYYPALATLFDGIGATLTPKVVAIHDVASQGAGHPDYVLQADTTHDTRASIEAKPAAWALDDLIASEQVGIYLRIAEVSYVAEMIQRIATQLALGPALDASYNAVKANTLTLA